MNKKGVALSNKNGRKTVTGLGYYECTQIKSLKEVIRNSVKNFKDKVAFKFKKDNVLIEKTYIEFAKTIDALGSALHHLGLKNKRIAIIAENRYEWALSFFSIVNGTGIAVPLDKHLPQIEIENLINRGKVDAICYSNHFSNQMLELSKKNMGITQFICMDKLDENCPSNFASIETLIEQGELLIGKGDKSFVDAEIDTEELAVLLFTSGTTSMSKGVRLNQRNICTNVSAIAASIKVKPKDVHLSILPLHHTFELSAGMIFMLNNGICIAYSEGIKHIAKNLKEFNVTALVVVPAILEAIYRKVQDGIKKSGKEKLVRAMGKISNAFLSIGIDFRRTLFKKILAQIGPDLRIAVTGAAPIDKEIVNGFGMLGITIAQGYGLTETSPVVAINSDINNKAGTVGQPIKGIEIAIDNPDENGMGEIITKGPNVMMGYYEDDNATKEAIDNEGWFHTGDLGYIDDEGFITITGRAKSMIVLNNGKKAFPEEYEMLLNNIDGVKESFVWGNTAPDGDIQICAKLVLDKNVLKEELVEVPNDSEMAKILQKEIKNINQELPQYKIIRYFVISYEDLVKTTTLKIKRSVEYNKITNLLNKLDTTIRKINGTNID